MTTTLDTLQTRTRFLGGIELRYMLTVHLFDNGPSTVAEMAEALTARGFRFGGRASKAISDALRWECGYDRVRRLGRGRYGPGWMPRGTEDRIHKRVLALRADVGELRGNRFDGVWRCPD